MKRVLLILVMLPAYLFIYSQPLQLQFAIQSGISLPLFEFAGTNLGKGSFALPGLTVSGETSLVLNKNLKGFVQAGIQLNPVDVGFLGYEKVIADPSLEDLYIRSEPYKVIHIIAGPAYQTRIGKSFLLEGQLAAGILISSTPYQLYKPKFFLGGPTFYEITASKDLSFAYGAGIRLAYEVTPCYQIGIATQFLQSKAAFEFKNSQGPYTDVRNISLWNTSLSIILKLFTSRV